MVDKSSPGVQATIPMKITALLLPICGFSLDEFIPLADTANMKCLTEILVSLT